MLYVVPTPIGNLRDITLRALDALKEADLVACEDTRRTAKLLNHFEIAKPLVSFHEHSGKGRLAGILEDLRSGKNVALVSDGGTPLINDPGFELVHAALKEGLSVEVLPGPSAITTALVGSGLAVDEFSFLGFLPAKSAARKKRIGELAARTETLIFFESPYRVLQALEDLREALGEREAVVARELTKKFEEFSRGSLGGLVEKFKKKKPIGEFVILVAGADRKPMFGKL